MEAAPRFRATTDALKQFQVRTRQGQMVSLGAMARAESSTTPLLVMRYNMYASAAINGSPAPGVSTGTMIDGITRMASELGIPFELTQITYVEVQAGYIALLIFALGTLLVYFVPSAKYESCRWR